jgi:hypothetical protein
MIRRLPLRGAPPVETSYFLRTAQPGVPSQSSIGLWNYRSRVAPSDNGLRFWLGFAEIGSALEIPEHFCRMRPATRASVLREAAPVDIKMGE